jgi:formylmethanofuran dehydrogenase subunit E
MCSKSLLAGVCVLIAASLNDEPPRELPRPHYDRQPSDPAWMQTAVQFHGHLGPSIIAGARLGMAGLHAVEAKGYFDVEVNCHGPFEKPPQSCFLDGLQIGTGATMGKRNLKYVEAKETVIRVKNTATGATVEICPTEKLSQLLGLVPSPAGPRPEEKSSDPDQKHNEMERVETLARQLADMPAEELFTIERIATPDEKSPAQRRM